MNNFWLHFSYWCPISFTQVTDFSDGSLNKYLIDNLNKVLYHYSNMEDMSLFWNI